MYVPVSYTHLDVYKRQITKLCFFVLDADAKNFFLTAGKVAFDDTNIFCAFANAAILSGILLHAFLGNGAIGFT